MLRKWIFSACLIAAAGPAISQAKGLCSFKGEMNLRSIHIVVGRTEGEGRGVVTCRYRNGTVERMRVNVYSRGVGLGAGWSNTKVRIWAVGIGIEGGGARSLLGEYGLVRAGAEVYRYGGDVAVGATASRHGFEFPLSLITKKGRGIEAAMDIGALTLAPAGPSYLRERMTSR